MKDKDRIKQLEDAIRKHKEKFPDEALDGEYELWSVLYLYDDKMIEERRYSGL